MTPADHLEATGPNYSLKAQLETRRRTFEAVYSIAANIRPGMLEEDAAAMARDLLGSMEMRKGWHKVVVRFGTNTIKEFCDTSEAGIVLGENDIFFVDIGPIYRGAEGDAGDTFVVGDNPEHARIKHDVRAIWDETRDAWFADGLTGRELYDFATLAAELRGWRLSLGLAGHRLSDFPHKTHFAGMLNEVDLVPRPDLWVLEMAIMDPAGNFGAFYEDLLLSDQAL